MRSRATVWLLSVLPPLLFLAGCGGERGIRDGAPPLPVDVSRIPDAVPHPEPPSRYGNPPSYRVDGHTYYTLNSSRDYRERGVASWYGSKFHGRLTSSREPYDMYAMTAAHKALPLPTYVRVTHLGNGRSVVVRVNDRGPFHANRLIDLSYTAAAKLDILRDGTGLVEVAALDPLHPESPSAPQTPAQPPAQSPLQTGKSPPETMPRLFLQVGAFVNQGNAARLHDRLSSELAETVRVQAPKRESRLIYRVQVGPLTTVEQADRVVLRLRQLGFGETRLVVE